MKLIQTMMILALTQNAWAKTESQDLLRVTVDNEHGIEYRLYIDYDSETRALKQMTYTDGTPHYQLKFTPSDLSDGVVMKKKGPLEVTALESEAGFSTKRGGHLNLIVMRKFELMGSDHRVLDLNLKQIDGIWKLYYVDAGTEKPVEKEFNQLGFYVLRKKDSAPTSLAASPVHAGGEIGVKMLELRKDEKLVAKKNTADLPK